MTALAAALACCAAHQAKAQAASDPQPARSAAQTGTDTGQLAPSPPSDVVVTGSRIVRRDLTSQTPIVTVSAEALASRGSPTIDTTLNQLPQFTAGSGSASSVISRGGQTNLNLRALGSLRTLVLIDGKRLQPANPAGSVDINILPVSLVENIETITGGASATYGSDAIAGVVNVKLRHRFTGVQLEGTSNVTGYGDAATRDISLTAGTDFADGRGNVMLAGTYSARDALLFPERSYLQNQALSTNLPTGAFLVNANNLPSQAAVNTIFARYGAAPGSVSRSTQFNFNDNGTIFRSANLLGYNGPLSGNGLTLLNNTLYSATGFYTLAQIPLQRYSGFGHAEFEAGPVTLFATGLYTRYDARTQSAPPNSSSTLRPLTIPVTNPFIPADLRTLLASRTTPVADFTITKLFDVLGPRTESDRYDVYQATLGAKGKLGIGDLSWNVYGTTGRTLYTAREINYPSITRVQNLLSAADGGASLCAGGFNPFGNQGASGACQAYIAANTRSTTSLRQSVVEGSVTGSIVQLPAGALSFAAGADYRRDSYVYSPDPLVASGDLANFLPSLASRGTIDVKEVFGELFVPLLADKPLFRALILDLGYRYSDYNISGGVSTYKADADWKPFPQLTVRGGYARAIRAPSVGELFTAASLTQVSLGTLGPIPGGNPCDIRSGYRAASYGGAAQVRALCLAQGVPTALIDSYLNTRTQTPTTTSGNRGLGPETADTYSLGGVLAPRVGFAPLSRFSLSVDYYTIKVRNAIGLITAPVAVQRCFNADGSNPAYSAANSFCQLVVREGASGLIANVTTPQLNLGAYRTSGIDITATLPIGLADLGLSRAGTVTLSSNVSRLLSFEIQTLPGGPTFDYAGTIGNSQVDQFSSARPTWKAVSSIGYADRRFDLSGRWRYIGPMDNAANVGVAGATLPRTDSISYFDIDAGLRVSDRFELRGGVTNVGNRKPPITNLSAVGQSNYDFNTYDLIGRRLFISFKAKI